MKRYIVTYANGDELNTVAPNMERALKLATANSSSEIIKIELIGAF
jgi:hypothetical protein